MKHLLATNDFPPKIGGIQNYLWELWKRLPSESFAVLTRPHKPDQNAEQKFDKGEPYDIHRSNQSLLLPTSKQATEIKTLAEKVKTEMLIFDPALPLGHLAPKMNYKYGLVFHGAEINIPAKLPFLKSRLKKTIANAELIITASQWAADEAKRLFSNRSRHNFLSINNFPPCHYIPPGVDTDRFVPLPKDKKQKIRTSYGVEPETFLVVCVSRLVPRKGIDVLIKAVAEVASFKNAQNEQIGKSEATSHPPIKLLIAGTGRDEKRLQKLIRKTNAPAQLLGRVGDAELPEIYGIGDVFSMPCRTRWMGMEQEGFGIVFMEAASCGVPSIAGKSGGATEAVVENETGIILDDPSDVGSLAQTLLLLIGNRKKLEEMGEKARKRAVAQFNYDLLAAKLAKILNC